ncbi:hypothetical protein M427DRAFT_58391 [Gonapodya prolifera JEL478]|uniref:DNA polymerase delta subunit 4 n=1 Tax=Gonapodya prolifera (strain JEL478) TaxID=1344416 RepID=A0A139AAW6_GONPJ|nr:hypothetical protein M427DRAFT_58391 [Gonapodya prolifera JEL478]|eukprot:KXS13799.1 hypothetical protein M427DRAFT_58391 [Gonapodya prolifera JEL478]
MPKAATVKPRQATLSFASKKASRLPSHQTKKLKEVEAKDIVTTEAVSKQPEIKTESLPPRVESIPDAEVSRLMKDPSKLDSFLREFDLDSRYGPHVGMTRMERWERAEELGLAPPDLVRRVLSTGKAQNEREIREGMWNSLLVGSV